ncbi:MAG: carbon storage regulator [Vampirovibrionales bacterium]
MLVLSRKSGQKIRIAEDILITILECRGDTIRIGIDAPKHVVVLREELYQDLSEANQGSKILGGVEHHTQSETDVLAQLSSHWAKHRQTVTPSSPLATASTHTTRVAPHLAPVVEYPSQRETSALPALPKPSSQGMAYAPLGSVSQVDAPVSPQPQVMITLEQLHEVLGEVLGEQILANITAQKVPSSHATSPSIAHGLKEVTQPFEEPSSQVSFKAKLPQRHVSKPTRHGRKSSQSEH